jgi:hypothetical protein
MPGGAYAAGNLTPSAAASCAIGEAAGLPCPGGSDNLALRIHVSDHFDNDGLSKC